ncbi:hypothetical protein D2E25_0234 [Bifidobacterium goeldii]|uniref:Uncharacterized protein n=1 Tax=Bifidobacterium goeldii TaxID=2306975 RepID=A0A430FMF2_9BIFI|nr:hypothetical protein [Bifidobacterium goeldii]RSX53928.1 hypothetical protein D2E25_0234 [Bifidobacterium goeldii]
MDDLIIAIAEWALVGVLGVIATALWRQLKRMKIEMDAFKRGMQMQLRGELIELHRVWIVDKGYMPVETKRFFHDMFCAYEDLGENGVISALYEDVKRAHVAPDPDEDSEE